ncbi:hypothetical protein [Thalassospira marina]|uniref:Secreted protein n=1 Tax=Thalassospira marina TaxID=2048283 RepID=A0ABM6QH37_9PROT|nr:hypothetical protein [Thalassospira marina]AUG51509.1 hypothetical protein CSC3H3_01380 [Thalassospira marina]AUG55913.1 hypothetical protein CSC3H3_24175 [Thalassospira marina]
MNRKHLRILAVAGLLTLTSLPASATYPVFDATSFAKITEQFNKLQQQFDELMKQTDILGKISKTAQDQINAIGKLGQVAVPVLNLAKLGQQINRDISCLLPDFSKLMPGVNLDDVDWKSICARRFFYNSTLWFDPRDPDSWKFGEEGSPDDWAMPEGGSWGGEGNEPNWKNPDSPAEQRLYFAARSAARKATEERRAQMAREAINTGLAQADRTSTELAEINQDIIEELESQSDQAIDVKTLLATLLKASLHQSRIQVQQQQQMAQLIRIQSNMLLQFRPAGDGGEQEGGDE